MAANKKGEAPKFLAGWKDIASYLGKGVRTVQRYEREMGLPVRRPAAKSRAAVVATKVELDAWVAASPYRGVFSLPRTISDSRAPARGITEGILEMVRLRDQMMELREELRTTLQTLHLTVENIHLKSVPPPPTGGCFPLRILIGETKQWLT